MALQGLIKLQFETPTTRNSSLSEDMRVDELFLFDQGDGNLGVVGLIRGVAVKV